MSLSSSKYIIGISLDLSKENFRNTYLYCMNDDGVYEIVSYSTRQIKSKYAVPFFNLYDEMLASHIVKQGQLLMKSRRDIHPDSLDVYTVQDELANLYIAYYSFKNKMNASDTLDNQSITKIIEVLQFSSLFEDGKFTELKDRIYSIMTAYEL